MSLPPEVHSRSSSSHTQPYPRILITYCTQCKWLLRAAYYAQELLSTFGTDIGEVSLRPGVGGVFWVDVLLRQDQGQVQVQVQGMKLEQSLDRGQGRGERDGEGEKGEREDKGRVAVTRIWDRKVENGFPETKILKRKVRDLIAPGKGLGHVDRDHGRERGEQGSGQGGDGVEGAEVKAAPSSSFVTPVLSEQPNSVEAVFSGESLAGDSKAVKQVCEDCN